MKKTVLLLQDWQDDDGTIIQSGSFVELDKRVADQLIGLDLAEEKTPEEQAEEIRVAKEAKRLADATALRDKQKAEIRVLNRPESQDPTAGYGKRGFGDFLKDVIDASRHGARPSEKLVRWAQASKVLHTGSNLVEFDDSQGGYLIPPEYAAAMHQGQIQDSTIRPRATYFPMGTNRIGINALVDNTHSGSIFGGITLIRPSETEQKTSTKPTFRQVWLTLHKLVGLVGVSDEMMEDSPQSITTLLTSVFGRAVAWQEDNDFLRGTGVGQPLGVLNAPCLITQAARPAQAATTVIAGNIIDMWSRLHPRSMNNAVWMCNASVLPQLYQMGVAVGTGGSVVFTPQGGLSGSPYAALMGRPLIVSEHCSALGTVGDIVLADFSQYAIGGKSASGAPVMASSTHIYFDFDITAFRFVLRYDGQPLWNSALSPAHGNSSGPFVVLDTRV